MKTASKIKKIVVSGKRKRAVARAGIVPGTGKITINKKSYNVLSNLHKLSIEEPLRIAKRILGKIDFDIDVKVTGGGKESQIESARLAIAKSIVQASKSAALKKAYLAYDRTLLVGDVRRKEAYKPGDSKARAKRQKSYR